MDLSTSMTELAETIQKNVASVEAYLKQHECAPPSLGVNGAGLNIAPGEHDVLVARGAILSTIRQLQNLVLGPVGILMNTGANEVLALQLIHRYQIAERLQVNEELPFDTLADRCGLNPVDLRRVLRYAMTNHIFCEPHPDVVAHTATSQLLATDPLIRDMAWNISDLRFTASSRTADALQKYGEAEDAAQTGFSLAYNTARGMYDEFAHDEAKSRTWDGAMQALAQQFDFDFIWESFDWGKLARGSTVLDVGGGRGDVALRLAQRMPAGTFVVQDYSTEACRLGAQNAAGLQDRVHFEHYDFRKPQSRVPVEVCYFRNIFHNWTDANCLNILRNQIPIMKPGTRLVIDDFMLHEPLTLSAYEDRRRRWLDMNMLIYFGSHERTLGQWKDLIARADPSFSIAKVTRAPNGMNAILEVEWVPENGIA